MDKFKHQLEQEQKLREDSEERLNQLEQEAEKKEKIEEAEKQKRKFLIKWSITTIALMALGIYVAIEYSAAWGLLKVIGVCGILLILWTFLTDSYGSKNPAIADYCLFKLSHELHGVIFYFIVAVAASLLADWMGTTW